MLHASAHWRRHYRRTRPLGAYSRCHRQERRRLCGHQRVEQFPESGLRGRPLFGSGRNCPPACRWSRADAQARWGDADMLFSVGLLRFSHFLLWGKECGRRTFLFRIEDGANRYFGSGLHLRYSWFRCRHGIGIRRRKGSALSSRHFKIHSDMAAQLHAQQTGNAFAGGEDETHSQPRHAGRQAPVVLWRLHSPRNPVAR